MTLLYGFLFGPPFAARDPLVKATATLGLLLILLGVMQWVWGRDAHGFTLPTTRWSYLRSATCGSTGRRSSASPSRSS